MYKVKIKKVLAKATPKLKEEEKLSRPQTEVERTKWLKKLTPSKYPKGGGSAYF